MRDSSLPLALKYRSCTILPLIFHVKGNGELQNYQVLAAGRQPKDGWHGDATKKHLIVGACQGLELWIGHLQREVIFPIFFALQSSVKHPPNDVSCQRCLQKTDQKF